MKSTDYLTLLGLQYVIERQYDLSPFHGTLYINDTRWKDAAVHLTVMSMHKMCNVKQLYSMRDKFESTAFEIGHRHVVKFIEIEDGKAEIQIGRK